VADADGRPARPSAYRCPRCRRPSFPEARGPRSTCRKVAFAEQVAGRDFRLC